MAGHSGRSGKGCQEDGGVDILSHRPGPPRSAGLWAGGLVWLPLCLVCPHAPHSLPTSTPNPALQAFGSGPRQMGVQVGCLGGKGVYHNHGLL